jgi:hypothetical protein
MTYDKKRIEKIYTDKTTWPRGEWDNEPDEVLWLENLTPCFAIRYIFGTFNGYVGVNKKHPLYCTHYDEVDITVHGGLTYAGPNPGAGEVPDHWWFGFDCNHYNDFSPILFRDLPGIPNNGIYKNLEFVINEITYLATELINYKKAN